MPTDFSPYRSRRRQFALGAGILAIALAVVAASSLWNSARDRAIVRQSVPERPNLADWPREFIVQIDVSEHGARKGDHAVGALGRLAQLYHANGFHNEALQAYEGLIDVQPENPRWRHLAAHLLAGYGRTDAAIPLLQEVVAQAPDYQPARLLLADTYFKSGDSTTAKLVFTTVLEADPGNPHALLAASRQMLSDGDVHRALANARSLSEKHPAFGPGWTLLATLEAARGDAEAAGIARRQAQQQARSTNHPPDPWKDALVEDCYDPYLLSVAAVNPPYSEDPAAAVRLLERAIRIDPENAVAHRQLGRLQQGRGHHAEARLHLETSTRLAPTVADGWIFLVRLLEEMEQPTDRARVLAEGLRHCPDSMSLHLERGNDLVRAHRLEEALNEFEEARRLRPEEPMPLIQIARVHLHRGDVEDGIVAMRAVLEAVPEHPLALSTLTLHAIQTGNQTEARDLLARARRHARMPEQDLNDLTRNFQEQFGSSP